MAGIFPQNTDGGMPPNAASPLNPTHAYAPQWAGPVNTSALYYGNGCDVRLRPEVVNSLISEMEAVVDRAGVSYDSNRLTNTELAIRYLIQRGLPKWCILYGGSTYYSGTLDPPATGYNDGMVIAIVPVINNAGPVWISLNGLPYAPLLRHDLAYLQVNDLRAGSVYLIAFYAGNWHICQLVYSQVVDPSTLAKTMTGYVDGWIRTDGNDTTGDGTANDPAHAFRTIEGAFYRLTREYAPNANFGFNLRLGIPGDYDAAGIAGIGGTQISIIGDPTTNAPGRGSYRIVSGYRGAGPISLLMFGLQVNLVGLTIYMNIPNADGIQMGSNGVVNLFNVRFENQPGVDGGNCVWGRTGSVFYTMSGGPGYPVGYYTTEFIGNGQSNATLINMGEGAQFGGNWANTLINTQNTNCRLATIYATYLGAINIGDHLQQYGTATGTKYLVELNAVILTNGLTIPGSAPGVARNGGVIV